MNDQNSDLQRHAMDTWQVIRNRFGLITLCFVLVFAAAAVLTYVMPRKYRGRVEMVIQRNTSPIEVLSRNGNSGGNWPEYVKTQIETISKPETLKPVIERLDLLKKWQTQTVSMAMGRLRGNLDVQASMRSDFVTIEFYDQDPNIAAEVANAVADSYQEHYKKVEMEQKSKSLETTQQQIADLEADRRSAQERAMEARKKAGITFDFDSGSSLTPGGAKAESKEGATRFMSREQRILQTEIDVRTMEADLDAISKLSTDDLISQAAALKLENPSFHARVAQHNEALVSLSGLMSSGLGKRHPMVRKVQSEIETLRSQINNEAKQHVLGLQSKLAASKQALEALRADSNVDKSKANSEMSLYMEYEKAKQEVEYIQSTIVQMRTRFLEEQQDVNGVKFPATVYAFAEPESRPTKPNVPLNLALGAVLGLMFGVGLAFFLEYMDTSVKNLDDVEKFLGVPVLAVVPKGVGILHRSSGFNPDSEAYRILRTNIEFHRKKADANCLTVVSGGAGEGKSTTMCNLAYVCAQGGYNVLLIDADLRRPSMHRNFDVSHTHGLTNYLTTNIRLEDVVLKTPVENLYFLPSGLLPADSAGILNSQRMVDLITDVKSRFDLVLIDSPPILGVSDASVLANEADMTMIVVQHRKLPRHMLMRVKQNVENVGGKVLGVVLNNVDLNSDAQYQYYTSYYTYYSPTNTGTDGKAERRKRRKQATNVDAPAPALATASKSEADVF